MVQVVPLFLWRRIPPHADFRVISSRGPGSVGLGMDSLDGEELLKGKTFVQDAECDSGNLVRGKVGSDKVMEDPVAI